MTTSPTTDLALHTYVFAPATDPAAAPTLLLLHGTGGDEHDLVPLGRRVAPGANLLSPRGNVSENGMPRFFRRLREGVFDQADLTVRTAELSRWIAAAAAEHGLDPKRIWALGFSNGANVAASLLLRGLGNLAGAVLIRAMVPFEPESPAALPGTPVLMLSGRLDPIAPPENAQRLASLLEAAGAEVRLDLRPVGHQLDLSDLAASGDWLGPRLATR